MNLEDMRIRISPMHRNMLRRMLGINELPEMLLKRYFGIKKLLDKVDGFLSTPDLVRIALDCGFNTETMLFDYGEQAFAVEEVVPEEDEPEPEMEQVPIQDKPIPEPEQVPFQDKPEPESSFDLDDTLEPEEEPVEEEELFTIGQPVEVFYDGAIVSGKVNGSKKEDGKVVYSIETEDDVIEVPETDVQEA